MSEWTVNNVGARPVFSSTTVEVITADRHRETGAAGSFEWSLNGYSSDIDWFRVVHSPSGSVIDPVTGAEVEEYDPVDRPEHYASGDIECIEAIQAALTEEEFRGYRKGSVIKYVWRERQKGGVESLRKARWHLDHLIAEQDE